MAPRNSKAKGAAGSRSPGASAAAANPKSKSKMTMSVSAPPKGSAKSHANSKGKGKARAKDHAHGNHNDDDEDDSAAESDYADDDEISLEGDEPDTDDEIEAAKNGRGKSKKTAKRKRRATSPTSFGLALESLLGTAPAEPSIAEANDQGASADEADEQEDQHLDEEEHTDDKPKPKKLKTAPAPAAQGSTILSLAPHLRRSAQSTKLNARASRIAIEQRRAREERAHVTDLIAGWGPPGELPRSQDDQASKIKIEEDADALTEWLDQGGNQGYERRLRKVAQRGVVKLFNAIRAAQTTTAEELEQAESKGTAGANRKSGIEAKKPVTVLSGKEKRLADLSKSNFLDLIRKGSSGSTKTGGIAAK